MLNLSQILYFLNNMYTSEKQIAEFFEGRVPLKRVTSIEITQVPGQNLNEPMMFSMGHEEEQNEEAKMIDKKEREEIIEMRMKFLKTKIKERENKTKEDTLYKYNRDDMIEKVGKILHSHLTFSEENLFHPSQGAMLFDERIFKRERWKVHTTNGFSGIQPVFLYCLEKIEYEVKPCSPDDIINFIKRIFVDMQLAIECILIMLIYIERIMMIGGVEIRLINWKPLVFMGILLASKFWEDLNFWNVDFLGVGQSYTLEGINQIESEFLGLCKYNLFVSAGLYAKYYFAVREKFTTKEVILSTYFYSNKKKKSKLWDLISSSFDNQEPDITMKSVFTIKTHWNIRKRVTIIQMIHKYHYLIKTNIKKH